MYVFNPIDLYEMINKHDTYEYSLYLLELVCEILFAVNSIDLNLFSWQTNQENGKQSLKQNQLIVIMRIQNNMHNWKCAAAMNLQQCLLQCIKHLS